LNDVTKFTESFDVYHSGTGIALAVAVAVAVAVPVGETECVVVKYTCEHPEVLGDIVSRDVCSREDGEMEMVEADKPPAERSEVFGRVVETHVTTFVVLSMRQTTSIVRFSSEPEGVVRLSGQETL
jgi:hypothetical protein